MLKTAEPRWLKPIISNCNRELVKYKSVCVLSVLNGNIKLTDWSSRKLQKQRRDSQSRRQAHVYLRQEENHRPARWISVASIEQRPTDDH